MCQLGQRVVPRLAFFIQAIATFMKPATVSWGVSLSSLQCSLSPAAHLWPYFLQEASSAEDLLAASCGVAAGSVAAMEDVPPGGSRAVYELTAAVVLIRQVAQPAVGAGVQQMAHYPVAACCLRASPHADFPTRLPSVA